jgi:hypothetical protein
MHFHTQIIYKIIYLMKLQNQLIVKMTKKKYL